MSKADFNLFDNEWFTLAEMFACMKGDPEINYGELAGFIGHSNPASTSNLVKRIRKKIGSAHDAQKEKLAGGGSAPSTPSKATSAKKAGTNGTPSKPRSGGKGDKRKRGEEMQRSVADGSDDGEIPETPSKKGKKGESKGVAPDGSDGDGNRTGNAAGVKQEMSDGDGAFA